MAQKDAPIRVLLVDDDPMVLTGIKAILRPVVDIETVGTATSGEEALQKVALHFPDVVLMDIRMPGMGGIQATERLVNSARAPKVVALTSFDTDDYLFRALEAGASGYLLKDVGPDELPVAIRKIHGGEPILSPQSLQRMMSKFTSAQDHRSKREAQELMASLTAKEREIAVLVAQGLSNREIAEATFTGEATVKTHINRIMMKLDANNRVLIAVAVERSGLAAAR